MMILLTKCASYLVEIGPFQGQAGVYHAENAAVKDLAPPQPASWRGVGECLGPSARSKISW